MCCSTEEKWREKNKKEGEEGKKRSRTFRGWWRSLFSTLPVFKTLRWGDHITHARDSQQVSNDQLTGLTIMLGLRIRMT